MKLKDIFRFSFLKLIIILLLFITGLAGFFAGLCFDFVGLGGGCPPTSIFSHILNIYGWIILFPAALVIMMMSHLNINTPLLGIIISFIVFVLNFAWLIFLSWLVEMIILKLFKKK